VVHRPAGRLVAPSHVEALMRNLQDLFKLGRLDAR